MSAYLNADCRCKIAEHAHGTHACYVVDKCRCQICRIAASAYERLRRAGEFDAELGIGERRLVDASEAAAHIKALQDAGLGWKLIARRAGLDQSTVYPLLWGRPDRSGGAVRTVCRPATRDAILAVRMPDVSELAAHRVVDGTATRNRVRALHWLGYGALAISRESGLEVQRIYGALKGRNVLAGTHVAAAAAFDRLAMNPRARTEHFESIAASRARNTAARNKWPSPFDLDDTGQVAAKPDAFEGIDQAAVLRAVQGDQSVRLTPDERGKAAEILAREFQMNREEQARHLGVASRTLLRDEQARRAA